MTIRFRNRLTFAFFIIAFTTFLLSAFVTWYQYLTVGITLPQVYIKSPSSNFFLRYNPYIVFSAMSLEMIYVCITTMIIYHSFEKTQAPDIAFFLIFLVACLCDATRFVIPVFQISGTYSRLLLKIGNIHLFARLLAPLALMGNTILSADDFRQHTDRNCLILIIVALFFSEMIPLNTAIILPNYCVSYGYVKAIRLTTGLVIILSTISLFFANQKNEYNQIMTLGFFMLSLGYSVMFYCYNIAGLLAGLALLGFGTTIYLNEVHKHYLWID